LKCELSGLGRDFHGWDGDADAGADAGGGRGGDQGRVDCISFVAESKPGDNCVHLLWKDSPVSPPPPFFSFFFFFNIFFETPGLVNNCGWRRGGKRGESGCFGGVEGISVSAVLYRKPPPVSSSWLRLRRSYGVKNRP
jgi:hypothetical protein